MLVGWKILLDCETGKMLLDCDTGQGVTVTECITCVTISESGGEIVPLIAKL